MATAYNPQWVAQGTSVADILARHVASQAGQGPPPAEAGGVLTGAAPRKRRPPARTTLTGASPPDRETLG
jgi:hypothetical protein